MKKLFVALSLLFVMLANTAQPVTRVLILSTVNAGNTFIYPSLKAELANTNVAEISWNGLNAIKILRYELEKSADGESFSYVTALPFNSNFKNQYSFKDKYLFEGINYYRLKIVDTKGNFSYTNTVSFNSNNLLSQVKVLSAIASKNLLVWTPATISIAKVIITDMINKSNLISNDVTTSTNLCNVNVDALKPGLYTLTLYTNHGIYSNLKFSKK